MGEYELKTRHGHNMYDISSLLQKSIRRCDIEKAGYAAMELFGYFHSYLWRRLIIISAEDCYGIMTKEIISLKFADDIVNKGKKGYDKDPLFVAKAITLLCMARKNRDGCYVACNFMIPDRCLEPEEIEHVDITKCKLDGELPDWVFDIHTIRGKMNGKTDLDMTITEQQALTPHQIGMFDDCSWGYAYEDDRKKGLMSDKEWKQYLELAKGRSVK